MQGSTSNVRTTRYSRGTGGYRAPEMLMEDTSIPYSNKVDVWALGCITHEIIFQTQAFQGDLAARDYARGAAATGQNFSLPTTSPVITDERRLAFLRKLICEMLRTDPPQRPRAADIYWRVVGWAIDDVQLSIPPANTPSRPPEDGTDRSKARASGEGELSVLPI